MSGKPDAVHESAVISQSPADAVAARAELLDALRSFPGTDEELERSLGLFLRGSLLARFLAIDHLYQLIVDKPGVVLDVGTWRGQTAVLCENLRAIREPLNPYRRIYCFDTFEGYRGFGADDAATALHREGTYDVGGEHYARFLESLLRVHERSNVNGHNHGKHDVVRGDVRTTLPKVIGEGTSEVVALAFLDLNSVEPTTLALPLIWDAMIPGGVLAIWQFGQALIPAERKVYRNLPPALSSHDLFRCPTYPGLAYLIKRA